ncbi:hypothetical protein I203_104100 [Kwoniella mangroviensis CBS 8507]|uniref:uncharacterized protein n=1 Tax=Kwoniella mangroviensis CBS 8507 TaxID=1296122 RepID=UPI00080D08A8|nr:uncharacterized protein I203_06406 [Kwoniella mangroviensis CBS 8507]OCF64671.1 hypothetical protein I203_06406 [Kwoniella mangroviensis CBS 8507]
MAKKSSNPADAFRKAQRAKELKKNKEERKKVREAQTVKKDTRELEAGIRYLKTQTDASSKTRLSELESELSYIKKTKEAYVAEHPEARDRVFGVRKPKENEGGLTTREESQKHLYDENGRLRDPKKSVYYDPVYNPFGVPPPGMPYKERTPDEVEEEEGSEDDDDDDDDEDIVMPEGPPPQGAEDKQEEEEEDSDDSDDSDDIPLPEGPPPPKPTAVPAPPPMRMGFGSSIPPFPPPNTGFRPPLPRPVAVPLHAHSQSQPYGQAGPSTFRPRHVQHNRPPPMVQDPLSDAPTQTYQGHRIAQHALPARPPSSSAADASAPTISGLASANSIEVTKPVGAGEISAAPVLRDLRKEATVFVPRGVKKRKTGPGGGIINAAPGAGEIDEEGDERKRTVQSSGSGGLMGKLKGVLGDQPKVDGTSGTGGGEDDEYKRFLEGLGDLS